VTDSTNDATRDPNADGGGEALALVVVDEERCERHALPTRGKVTIGRAPEANVRIKQPWVSRVHATLHVDGGVTSVEDVGSSYGTKVRGQNVEKGTRVPLVPGDVIELGATMLVLQRRALPGAGVALERGEMMDHLSGECGRAARLGLAIDVVAIELGEGSEDAIFEALAHAHSLTRFAKLGRTAIAGAIRPATAVPLARRVAEQLAIRCIAAAVASDTHEAEDGLGDAERLITRALLGFAPLGHHGDTLVFGPSSLDLHDQIESIAKTRENVLLEGETGVGKDALARLIHVASAAKGPLVRIAASSLSVTELPQGGTLVIDDVGAVEDPKHLGDLLARAEGQARVVALSQRELRGVLPDDVYYRVAGARVVVPPLRERLEDIDVLARHFALIGSTLAERRRLVHLADDLVSALHAHPWPGNVRELRSVIIEAVTRTSAAFLRREDMPHLGVEKGATDLRAQLATLERQRIVDALDRCGGNQSAAAKLLGMPRNTLIARIREYGLPQPRKAKRQRPS